MIRDRDTKFSSAFDDVWRSIGAQIIRTPVPTPVANAFAERWVGTVRRECLDHLLVVGCRHLQRVLPISLGHFNQHRSHRGLGFVAPGLRDGMSSSDEGVDLAPPLSPHRIPDAVAGKYLCQLGCIETGSASGPRKTRTTS